VICTSSMEAEFIIAVSGGKSDKYVRSILNQLGIRQVGPTLMNIDNESAMKVVLPNNHSTLTCRSLP
jgi:hypothetical protein